MAYAIDALNLIASEHETGPFTTAQKLSILISLCGVRVIDNYQNIDLVNQTYTLIYTDPTTGKSNYQTACVPSYTISTPFILLVDDNGVEGLIRFEPGFDTFAGIDLTDGYKIKIHARIGAASNHYYSRVDPNLRELPTAMLVSPYTTCAGGCRMCSRAAANTFTKSPRDYIEAHVRQVAIDYHTRTWDPLDLWSVNLVTGCQSSIDREMHMMLNTMKEYYKQGFNNVRFHIYSYLLTHQEHMTDLRRAGAIGHIGTLETFDNERRLLYWGREKGATTFDNHLKRYAKAHEVGYPIVETNYVIGTDSYSAMMKGIKTLDNEGVAVVPNMMRSYNSIQVNSLHSDLWEMGFRYILDGFQAATKTYRHPTIKRYAGNHAVEYLRSKGLNVTYDDLPIRHT